jgi:hypothetical protein
MTYFRQLKRLPRLAAVAGGVAVVLIAAAIAVAAQSSNPTAAYTTNGAWSFVSEPNLHPPKLHTDRPTVAGKLAPGYFLVASFKDLTRTQPMTGQGGPLLLDSRLQPVWFKPICVHGCASQDLWTLDPQLQTYQGKPALSWWQGALSPVGVTLSGELVVVDQHYRSVATLKGAQGWVIDSHDLVISGSNAWVTVAKNVPMDLSAYGGSAQGTVVDTAIQEYNLKTGQLLYTWDPLQHIPLADSETKPSPKGTPWDAYHANSIQLGNGTFLSSFRNTWAGYLVNIKSQAVEWTLGGKHSTFTLGRNAQFEWQHDIQLHPQGVVSLFDDHCCAITGVVNGIAQFAPASGPARGLVLRLDMKRHTAALGAQYVRAANFDVAFSGNTQLLPNGNVLVGWGSRPYFSEYSQSGRLLFDGVFPSPNNNYRSFVRQWVGRPYFPPTGAARRHNGKATVYASWDGATEVQAWRVLAGSNAQHLTSVALGPKTGFETAIGLGRGYSRYRVQALDAKGHVLGTSAVFPKQQTTTPSPGFY